MIPPVSYLNPGGTPGDVLKGVATCDKSKFITQTRSPPAANVCPVGKTLAYTTVQFFNSKGQLAARGSHTK